MTCPICNDEFMVIVAGPDENGMYDADDCPCQLAEPQGGLDQDAYWRSAGSTYDG